MPLTSIAVCASNTDCRPGKPCKRPFTGRFHLLYSCQRILTSISDLARFLTHALIVPYHPILSIKFGAAGRLGLRVRPRQTPYQSPTQPRSAALAFSHYRCPPKPHTPHKKGALRRLWREVGGVSPY
jgi:hypothetical protein